MTAFPAIYLLVGLAFAVWIVQQPEIDNGLNRLNLRGQLIYFGCMIMFGPLIIIAALLGKKP